MEFVGYWRRSRGNRAAVYFGPRSITRIAPPSILSRRTLVPAGARVRVRAGLRADVIVLARKIIAPRVPVRPEHLRTGVIGIVRIVGRRG
jgi:hypothetical protein